MAGHQGAILDASKQPPWQQQSQHTGRGVCVCMCMWVCVCVCASCFFFPLLFLIFLFPLSLLRESFLKRDTVNTEALSRLPVTQGLLDQIESCSQ